MRSLRIFLLLFVLALSTLADGSRLRKLQIESLDRLLQTEINATKNNVTYSKNNTTLTNATIRVPNTTMNEAIPAGNIAGEKDPSAQLQLQQEADDPDAVDLDLAQTLGFGCFPEDVTVQVEHRPHPVLMKDLRMGDRVWTANHQYSPVYAFGHRLPDQHDRFVQIQTRIGMLELTGEHLLYLNGKANPVRADSIQPGDVLEGGFLVFATSSVVRKGLYAPFTVQGTMVVNGLAVSSYVSLQPHAVERLALSNGWTTVFLSQHQFLHMGLSPLRMACLGISSKFCDHQNPRGMPQYVSFLLSTQEWIERLPAWIQCILLILYLVVMGFGMAVEVMVGASEAPSAVMVLSILYWMGRALRLQVRVKVIYPSRR